MSTTKIRCAWCSDDPLYQDYHDHEWGVPEYDDRKLFEMLILEGAQAGLSWITILRKRENYRAAFDNFDPKKVARYDETKIAELMANDGIVRNRLKLESAVKNAKVFLDMQKEFGSFSAWLWLHVNNTALRNSPASLKQVPAQTELSDKIAKSLKKRGMNFVGSTIIYAFLQATGVVNDHTRDCFRHGR